MGKRILCAVIVSLIACNYSCDNMNIQQAEDVDDPSYPTTIYRLPEKTLLQKRTDFAKKNPNLNTSLDPFGFCAMLEANGGNGSPGGFTEAEAIAAVKNFVARNPEYTGVKNPDNLKFRSIQSTVGYNNAVFWHFRTENQVINGIEVDFTEILFHTQNKKLVSCYGNHYPNVYIPKKMNYDVERAKSQLLGEEVTHWGWTGPYSLGKIQAKHLQNCITQLVIIPLITDEKIELRVARQIRLDAMYYIFDVDVMTGEIIRETPTIIF